MLIDVPHDSIVHQRYKRINYYYDLVSGKVNEIIYEPDSIDQFIHVYQYDADNRITDVMTSRDSLYWENDASYEYYDHGPLAREVIGQRQVQGVDYAYTLNGWVKAINSGLGGSVVKTGPSHDMGGDGDVHGANATIGRDAYGYVLNYFTGDYRSIAKTTDITTGLPTSDLYNGNISGATYAIKPLSPSVMGYAYGYDQLNRMVSMLAFKGIDTVHNTWVATDSIKDLREKVNYDDNGNILSYLRHGNTAIGHLGMDSLTYHYNKNTNQLAEVTDVIPSTYYSVDIDNETSKHNYRYNGIGELASDSIAGIDSIYWTVYYKVKKIVKTNNDSIVFMYDPLGNRLEERNFPHTGTADTTKYARDASGNIMAIYDRKKDTVRLSEFDIYGNRRIGSLDTVLRMQKFITGHGTLDSLTINYLERQKQYELDNHLENVLITVSDGKSPVDTMNSGDTIANYYIPIIVNAQDYYPFGMLEPGRTYNLNGDSAYRYLFNGKWHNDNIWGNDNSYDYGKRFYDPRLGRFLSIDPLEQKYPYYSPYQFAGNKPIWAIDLEGLEEAFATDYMAYGNMYRMVTLNPDYNPHQNPADEGEIEYKSLNGSTYCIEMTSEQRKTVTYLRSEVKMHDAGAPSYTSGKATKITRQDDQTIDNEAVSSSNNEKKVAGQTPSISKTESKGGFGFTISGTPTCKGGDLWSPDQKTSTNGTFFGGEGYATLLDKIASEVKQNNDVTSINVDVTVTSPPGVQLNEDQINNLKQGVASKTKEYLRSIDKVNKNIKIIVNVKYDANSNDSEKVKITTK